MTRTRFGEIVVGPPGSGKSTYCNGKHQLFTALGRPVSIVNLDPANEDIKYPCALDIRELVKLEGVMEEWGLGPNGGMLWCMEYLEENFDWLEEGLGGEEYVLFDLPGQVEVGTNHDSLRRVLERLGKAGWSLATVHLCDSHSITSPFTYISTLLLSLRTMLHLQLPHINVLSKIDLLGHYGELAFNLDFYTEVQDLSYLENLLDREVPPRFAKMNKAIMDVVEDYGLVGFETLAVEDKQSMLHLTHAIDRATGYVFIPKLKSDPDPDLPSSSSSSGDLPNTYPLLSTAFGPLRGLRSDVRDVQERWVDERERWDKWEAVGGGS